MKKSTHLPYIQDLKQEIKKEILSFEPNNSYEGVLLSKNNMICSLKPDLTSKKFQFIKGTIMLKGKTHFTILITSKKPTSFTHAIIGVCKYVYYETFTSNKDEKFDTFYGYSGIGIAKKISKKGNEISYPFGSSFGVGDKITIVFDDKEELVLCYKNGIFQGTLIERFGIGAKNSDYSMCLGLCDSNFNFEILPDEKEPFPLENFYHFQPTNNSRVEYKDNYRTVILKKSIPFCFIGTRAFQSKKQRYYFEFTVNNLSKDSIMILGFIGMQEYRDLTMKSSFIEKENDQGVGHGYGYASNGKLLSKNKKDRTINEGYTTGDVIGFTFDYQKKNIHIYKNREYICIAFMGVRIFPTFVAHLSSANDSITFDDSVQEPSSLVCTTSDNSQVVEVRSKKMAQYKILKKIGGGGFGQIFLCEKKDQLVALKRIECENIDESNDALNEYSQLKPLEHPNILKTFDSFIDTINDALCVLIESEYYEEGDLFNYVLKNNNFDKIECILQIITGIEYLHNKGIIHRDLKPQNILVKKKDDKLIFCICDFGFAKSKEEKSMNSVVGTTNYMSIEMIRDKSYSFPVDIFAFGGILFYLFTKKEKVFYLELLTNSEKFYSMIHQEMKEFREIGDLIVQCFNQDQTQRPKASEIKDYIEKLRN